MNNYALGAKLLTIDELSEIINLTRGTIKNQLSSNPTALPPRRIVCGTRCVRFLSTDVERWMAGLPILQGTFNSSESSTTVNRLIPVLAPSDAARHRAAIVHSGARRGRPTKAMQVAKRNEEISKKTRAA